MVFMNKWVMKNYFPYPLFITWVQLFVSEIIVVVTSFLRYRTRVFPDLFVPLEWNWSVAIDVLPLTCVWLLNMMCTNISLKYTEVTFFQLLRALSIVWTVIFQQVNLPDLAISSKVKMSCFVVFGGFILGSIGEVNFTWLGLFFSVITGNFYHSRPTPFTQSKKRLDFGNNCLFFCGLLWIPGEKDLGMC
eukprot:TRINITY_DN1960_c0_g1_i10.p1 TRINITY_DN1960_c0_g1~~TRINITY_DN1960_c0_g1_i10.p1  ORF type:complete len:190 (+),score=15.57 TRINITY_DN1960_c0_g1_i10:178-747(+)